MFIFFRFVQFASNDDDHITLIEKEMHLATDWEANFKKCLN